MKMKRSKDKRFNQKSRVGVIIREGEVEGLGCYDEKTCTVTIKPGLPQVGKHIIVLHELLHAVDAQMLATGLTKRRIPHEWIKNAAPTLLTLLISTGFWDGPSLSECKRFFDENKA